VSGATKIVRVGEGTREARIGGGGALALIAGPCVIEGQSLALEVAFALKEIAARLGMPFVYKSSYTKDNRSSVDYYQGPGLSKGLEVLARVRDDADVAVLSDVHGAAEAAPAASVLDMLQIPAYLSQQTSLALACGETGKPVNVKKGQFIAPEDMAKVAAKIASTGNEAISLTERGSVNALSRPDGPINASPCDNRADSAAGARPRACAGCDDRSIDISVAQYGTALSDISVTH